MADDSVEMQRLVKHVLSRAGADVLVVGNGRDAVELAMLSLATRPYDVVLMDIQMPVLDGISATRRLRSLGYRRPIVALTSLDDKVNRRRCLAAGCDEHIPLPVNPVRLIEAIFRFAGSATGAGQLRHVGAK